MTERTDTPTDQPERLDLRSHDVVGDKIAQLVELFPEIRTEGGQIDFDRLRHALGESIVPGKER
jgi:adenine-specific DNA-methyltransferase